MPSTPQSLSHLKSALTKTISSYGTDSFHLNAGTAMGVALVEHPDGVVSDFLERDITDAVSSNQPIHRLEELLNLLPPDLPETSAESVIVNGWGAVALAIGEALDAHEREDYQRYHTLCGVGIGISRALGLDHFHTDTPLDVMIQDGVASDDFAKLKEVRRFCNAGLRLSEPIFVTAEAHDEFDNSFDRMTSRILACGESDRSNGENADNQSIPRSPLDDPSEWIALNRAARRMKGNEQQ